MSSFTNTKWSDFPYVSTDNRSCTNKASLGNNRYIFTKGRIVNKQRQISRDNTECSALHHTQNENENYMVKV